MPDMVQSASPSDLMLRYGLQTILHLTRRGAYSDGMDYSAYMENPKPIFPADRVPFSLVIPLAQSPDFKRPSGTFYHISLIMILRKFRMYNYLQRKEGRICTRFKEKEKSHIAHPNSHTKIFH